MGTLPSYSSALLSLMRHLRVLLLLLLLPLLAAAQPAAQPLASAVQARLDTLSERKLPEAEESAAKQALQQTLTQLSAAEDSRNRLASLRQQLERAPALISEGRSRLAQRQESPPPPIAIPANATLETLDARLADRNAELTRWRSALDDASALSLSASAERAQTEIGANQTRMQQIEASLRTARDGARTLSPERRDALAAEWYALDARVAVQLAQLSGSSLLQDLGQVQRERAQFELARIERDIEALQSAISAQRKAQTLQTLRQLTRTDVSAAAAGSVLAREAAVNDTLSSYLLRSSEQLADLTQRKLDTRQRLDALNRSSSVITEQINILQGSPLLARILYEQRRTLPQPRTDDELAERISEIRLYQFEMNKQREALANPARYARQLLAQGPVVQGVDTNTSEFEALQALLATRSELLDSLNRELSALLSESVTLQLNETQLQTTAERLRTTLDEQMFWVPSNRPLDLEWFAALPGALERQLTAMPWRAVAEQLWQGLLARPLVLLPVLLISLVLLLRRRWLRNKLHSLHGDIGYVRRDSQLHTPLAILFNILLALPVSLLLALAGLALQIDGRGQNLTLGLGLMEMAKAWLVFYTAYRVLSPGGIAERHFEWKPELTHAAHRRLRHLGLVVLAVVLVVTLAEHQPEGLADDVLGILTLLAVYAVMAWLIWQLLSQHRLQNAAPSPLMVMFSIALALMPLALIAALSMGYYYTALKLTGRLIDTLSLLIIWGLTEATAVRALAVAARRLEHQRAVERREAAEREAGLDVATDSEVLERPVITVEKLSQQSLRLVHLGLLAALLGGLYWVWADLITVFAYLDNITLYEYSSTVGDASSLIPITLSDVLGALVIAILSFTLARNLPGLLEVLVLSRMQLAQGSAYAITTLLSYVIAVVGFVATLSTLGVSWDKLQWLVAALSVGLGFGLQEIFANFVSGLIILFERPVRIGDVVTIGELSGTVSRIQIRATTITDFDRKEIIVPNKTFVTGQLLNWSLSDTVTRVTVKLGVAYGSDLELTRRLLLQIADDNARVLKDPEPLVLFLSFGASTLDHELRIHVRELGDRNLATDEINRRIDILFKENGIEIAFNQIDVHVRSIDGKEARLETISRNVVASAHQPASDGSPPPR